MDTSITLLDSLKQGDDANSWQRFFDIYSPLIHGWLKRHGLQQQDADDLTQNVLTVVFPKLRDFDRQRVGSFRKWLRTVTYNCCRDFWRSKNTRPAGGGNSEFHEMLQQLEDPHSGVSQLWNKEHDQRVMRYLLEQIKSEFKTATYEAFRRLVFDEAKADDVAAELVMTSNAVFIAKSRVLKRLREIGANLID